MKKKRKQSLKIKLVKVIERPDPFTQAAKYDIYALPTVPHTKQEMIDKLMGKY